MESYIPAEEITAYLAVFIIEAREVDFDSEIWNSLDMLRSILILVNIHGYILA
jgi:hypothetical protein